MKPLHLIKNTNTRYPAMNYARVKNGFVDVTDAHCLLKLPVQEIFGKDVITATDELYFELRLWQSMKFDKAVSIARKENEFLAYDRKGQFIGMIRALTVLENMRFPDVDVVLPTTFSQVPHIAFDHKLFSTLCSAWNADVKGYRFYFSGINKGITVKHIESTGTGLVMPIYADEWNEKKQ